ERLQRRAAHDEAGPLGGVTVVEEVVDGGRRGHGGQGLVGPVHRLGPGGHGPAGRGRQHIGVEAAVDVRHVQRGRAGVAGEGQGSDVVHTVVGDGGGRGHVSHCFIVEPGGGLVGAGG